uniref:NudC domain-containing protein 1 n=1 Tax=Ditylenchus dipsaci TaxID=166011 RepID=A0A915D9S4_9BILA
MTLFRPRNWCCHTKPTAVHPNQQDRLVVDNFNLGIKQIAGYIPLQDGSIVGAQLSLESFHWTPTTSFVDEQHAVATNSLGQLQLFNTGNRQSIENWTMVLQEDLSPADSCPTLSWMLESRCNSEISPTRNLNPIHMNKLFYLSILKVNGQFNIVKKQEACCAGCLVLATFDQQVEQVIIAVEKGPNSEKPELPLEKTAENDKAQEVFTVNQNFYFWTQSEDELTAYFKFTPDVNRADVKIDVVEDQFNMTHHEIILINSKLGGDASLKSAEWIDADDVLVVTLAKNETGKWKHSCLELASNKKQTSSDVNPLFNLEQLESCDQTDSTLFFYWLDRESLDVRQKADLTGNQILFPTQFSANTPKGFASRYDVDGIVWSFGEQKIDYQHTLNAFGYIHAGHEGIRFAGCSPDAKYATLVNRRNHAFVYFQNASLEKGSELRNRKTGRVSKTVAKQMIFTLAKSDPEYNVHVHENEFIGFYAANDVLLLLTPNAVYALNLQVIKNE